MEKVKYFLGIEFLCKLDMMVLSQHECVVLLETKFLGYKLEVSLGNVEMISLRC